MNKSLVFIALAWLCTGVFAQGTPAAAAPASAAQPTATPAPAATGIVGGQNTTYSDRIPPEQLIALDANGDKFQARYIADLSGQPRGAVIILHDSGQHPTWPFTAAALIDDLPLHGWSTLNIELPAPTSATAEPAAATPAALGSEAKTQARINAAIKYFTDQNQRNIVLVGFGSGAIRAAENLRLIATANPATPGKTDPLTALVMIAPLQKLNGIELDLPKLLPLTGIAALDMNLSSEPQARAEAEERRRAVLHQRTRIYTRLELAPLNNTSDAQHSTMVKRVRTWLQANAQARPPQEKAQMAAPN